MWAFHFGSLKQRLPLSQVPVARMVQGIALIAAGYLGLAWVLKSMRIVIFSFIPFQYLVFLLLGLTGIMYFGYLRVTGADTHKGKSRMENELDSLRRKGRF